MTRSSFRLLALVLFILGLFIMFSSVDWGMQSANAYLRSQGGGMDTAQFMIVVQESIATYRWIGIVLSAIGGLGFVRAMENRTGG